MPPALRLADDRREAEIAPDVSTLRNLRPVQPLPEELRRLHERLRCAFVVKQALDKLQTRVGEYECLRPDVGQLEMHLIEQDLLEEFHSIAVLLQLLCTEVMKSLLNIKWVFLAAFNKYFYI